MTVSKIFTIGHSNLSIEDFLRQLQLNQIGLVIDVRTAPYSQYVPHFNRETLKAALEDKGIQYLYYGNKLGGRPPDGINNFVHTDRFKENVKELLKILDGKVAAIMCSELDMERCHRRFIVEEITLNGLDVIVIEKHLRIIPAKSDEFANIHKPKPSEKTTLDMWLK